MFAFENEDAKFEDYLKSHVNSKSPQMIPAGFQN